MIFIWDEIQPPVMIQRLTTPKSLVQSWSWVILCYPFSTYREQVREPVPFRIISTLVVAYKQLVLPPGLSGITVIIDASSVDSVAQCTMDINSSRKMGDCIDYLQGFVLYLQIFVWLILYHCILHCCALLPIQANEMSTDVIKVLNEKINCLLIPTGKQPFRVQSSVFLDEMLQTRKGVCVEFTVYLLPKYIFSHTDTVNVTHLFRDSWKQHTLKYPVTTTQLTRGTSAKNDGN